MKTCICLLLLYMTLSRVEWGSAYCTEKIKIWRKRRRDISTPLGVLGEAASGDYNEVELESLKEENHARFAGVGRLYGTKAEASSLEVVERLSNARVAVIGLGGVGSWAAEALCRSGVGSLVLVDMDEICVSNTNRQLHAMASTVGASKIHQMEARLKDINPHCNVTALFQFISTENAKHTLSSLPPLTACIDAIDASHEKAALIAACAQLAIPVVTCGGSAGRIDPTQILISDITKANDDRLLFRCRKVLRQDYHFPKGPKQFQKNTHRVKKWNVFAVCSTEVQNKTNNDAAFTSSLRACDSALGTACFVTGTYGFVAASCVVEMIASDNIVLPFCPDKLRDNISS